MSDNVKVEQRDKDISRAFWDAWDLSCSQAEELARAFARHRLAERDHMAPAPGGEPAADMPTREELVGRVGQEITTWAFAHGIDGSIRNDLMRRIDALLAQVKGREG